MDVAAVPTATHDPINARILAISEDKLQGFQPDPISEIAKQSGVDVTFRNGEGMKPSEGEKVKGFAIAGEDRKFVWADVEIAGQCRSASVC